jgi:hypothetical protein
VHHTSESNAMTTPGDRLVEYVRQNLSSDDDELDRAISLEEFKTEQEEKLRVFIRKYAKEEHDITILPGDEFKYIIDREEEK